MAKINTIFAHKNSFSSILKVQRVFFGVNFKYIIYLFFDVRLNIYKKSFFLNFKFTLNLTYCMLGVPSK